MITIRLFHYGKAIIVKTSIHKYLTLFLLLIAPQLSGQQFFRIRAEVTIKTILTNGEQSLTMGQVFYDRNERMIVYRLSFPEPEDIITADTVTYSVRNGAITHRVFSPSMVEFSVFHLALSSNLPDYGLKKTQFEITQVVRDQDLVITTWNPPAKIAEDIGQMKVSVKDKKLFGVIFYTPEGEISRKQLFENYIIEDGLVFPGRIVEISYTPEGENYQVMTFKNITIDEMGHNDLYHYRLPGR